MSQATNSSKHTTRVRVRYAETDQMGIVYHANYLIWMEIGRVELVRSRGFNYKDLEREEGILLAVTEVECRYLYPARYDQEVTIQTEVLNANPRMIEFGYDLSIEHTGRRIATGKTRHIWLNRDMRPTRLPERYAAVLQIG